MQKMAGGTWEKDACMQKFGGEKEESREIQQKIEENPSCQMQTLGGEWEEMKIQRWEGEGS